MIKVRRSFSSLLSNNFCFLHSDIKWKQNGITIAGGNGKGNQLNQLSLPFDICIDDDQTIYIADYCNCRIVKWKSNATSGRIVANENEIIQPMCIIIDKETSSLIIFDRENRRIMGCTYGNNTNREILISDIDCLGITMDKNGSLYAVDREKNEVKRWKRGEKNATVVAGGNGKGNHLNQLDSPTFICIDKDDTLYVSDSNNHRVMKWMKYAKEGIIVAGGNGQGNRLSQLNYPQGVIVDDLCQIYIVDFFNDRVMRWCREATEGTIVIGGNGRGAQSNQLKGPRGLSFDRQGNLYVADGGNDRIQKFEIN